MRRQSAGYRDSTPLDNDPLLARTVQFDFSGEKGIRSVHSVRNKSVWDDDEKSEDEGNESQRQEAVEEAKLQVSFAEQTAKEMKQVLSWWTLQSPKGVVSQSPYLKENSLVCASPRIDEAESNDQDAPRSDDERPMSDETTCVFQCPLLFPNEKRTYPHENLFLLPSTLDTRSNPKELFFSPIATANSPWIDLRTIESHKEAQEQSFAVNIVCSEVNHMMEVLADLEDTSEDEDSVSLATIYEPPQWCCSIQDLPFHARYRLVVWSFFRHHFLQLQQHLLHTLPPSFVWIWLSVRPYRKDLLHFFLPAILLAMMYITGVWNPESHTTPSYKGWESHYQAHSQDSDLCEFIQDAFL